MTTRPHRPAFAAHPVAAKYARHVNATYVEMLDALGYGRVFVRARDVWVWDDEGTRYLDLLAGFGSHNVGHNHPRLVEALNRFLADEPLNLFHAGPSPYAGELAEALASRLPSALSVCLPSNGGAEAVEAGIKLARAATRRTPIVYCNDSYHGTSLATLSVMSERRMRDPFEPLLHPCLGVPFGDIAALEGALAASPAAAFIVEPIQAEAGVVLPPAGYLAEAKRLCERHGALLILDEVQTGIGRTGTRFAFESQGMVPDILVLAKALGGGIAPIGATVTTAAVNRLAYESRERFDLHGSTFGGNSFSCVAALATLRIVDDERLAENAAERGDALIAGLRARLADHPLVRDIRGQGLLMAIEVGPAAPRSGDASAPAWGSLPPEDVACHWIALRLLESGIVCQPAIHAANVLKIEPPLTIAASEVEHAVDVLGRIFDEGRSLPALLEQVAARISQRMSPSR